MGGMKKVIDEIGGVEIASLLSFKYKGYILKKVHIMVIKYLNIHV